MKALERYRGKRVLITGHTGFKGSYLSLMLKMLGAEVTGYALSPPTDPSLFALTGLEKDIRSVTGDVRDFEALLKVFRETEPEYVFHLAAQPIVRLSYREPVLTYETNVMGTVNLLECVRQTSSVRSVINVTTDKVYENDDLDTPFTEDMPLDGYDPYSNSKSCSELVTHSYKKSFFSGEGAPAVSTARAGNVIGGGDFAEDRLIPDCVRAVSSGETIIIRNPESIRPYQHVLEPVRLYAVIASEAAEDKVKADYYNIGPDLEDCLTAGELAERFCRAWGEGAAWAARPDGGPHEAAFLRLDCGKIKRVFGWRSVWGIDRAMEKIVEFSKRWLGGGDLRGCVEEQIKEYLKEAEEGQADV